jgi:hypothetical protein
VADRSLEGKTDLQFLETGLYDRDNPLTLKISMYVS